jgi:hypothetical protein
MPVPGLDPGTVPGIAEDVDGRDKPGHDASVFSENDLV